MIDVAIVELEEAELEALEEAEGEDEQKPASEPAGSWLSVRPDQAAEACSAVFAHLPH